MYKNSEPDKYFFKSLMLNFSFENRTILELDLFFF